MNIKINLTTEGLLWASTGVLAFNTGCLIDAIFTIRKYEKTCKLWQKNHYYMMKINQGLNKIATNPNSTVSENVEAIQKLLDDVNAEILLDQVDFTPIVKDFASDE